MSLELKLIWNPLTPGSVPAGARISAGKSGRVARSLPTMAEVAVNWEPVSCIPSPESPAKRMTTLSTVSCDFSRIGCSVSVSMTSHRPRRIAREPSKIHRDEIS